jgi:hypothetical protein
MVHPLDPKKNSRYRTSPERVKIQEDPILMTCRHRFPSGGITGMNLCIFIVTDIRVPPLLTDILKFFIGPASW